METDNGGVVAVVPIAIPNNDLFGPITPAELTPFDSSGQTIDIFGTLNNAGSTLTVGNGSAITQINLESGSVVQGGDIDDTGSGIIGSGGTIVLTAPESDSALTIQDSETLNDVTIDLSDFSSLSIAAGATLTFGPGATLDATGSYSTFLGYTPSDAGYGGDAGVVGGETSSTTVRSTSQDRS